MPLYLALRNIAKKWTIAVKDWKAVLNRFAIVYENRLPVDLRKRGDGNRGNKKFPFSQRSVLLFKT
jgi:hypothetical protein